MRTLMPSAPYTYASGAGWNLVNAKIDEPTTIVCEVESMP